MPSAPTLTAAAAPHNAYPSGSFNGQHTSQSSGVVGRYDPYASPRKVISTTPVIPAPPAPKLGKVAHTRFSVLLKILQWLEYGLSRRHFSVWISLPRGF